MTVKLANDNGPSKGRVPNDPLAIYPDIGDDLAYVSDYMLKVMEHFKECGISHMALGIGLIDSYIHCLPGNPFIRAPDELELRGALVSLIPAAKDLEERLALYHRAIARCERNRAERLAADPASAPASDRPTDQPGPGLLPPGGRQ